MDPPGVTSFRGREPLGFVFSTERGCSCNAAELGGLIRSLAFGFVSVFLMDVLVTPVAVEAIVGVRLDFLGAGWYGYETLFSLLLGFEEVGAAFEACGLDTLLVSSTGPLAAWTLNFAQMIRCWDVGWTAVERRRCSAPRMARTEDMDRIWDGGDSYEGCILGRGIAMSKYGLT